MFYKEKFYSLINWKNRPNLSTPLGAKNLNEMDKAIGELDERVVETSIEAEKNKLNIQNLSSEVESASKEIEEVRTETNSSIDALKIVPTASGSQVYIFDASNMNNEGIDFFGESKQRQTTGKNELNASGLTTQTTAEITFTPVYDEIILLEYINVNGTWDSSNTATNTRYKIGTWYPKTKGKYILSGMTNIGDGSFLCLDKNGGGGDYEAVATTSNEFTVAEDAEYYDVWLRIANGTSVSNLKVYPMIRLASVTDATYEPYTGGKASPSPDYPQPIESTVVERVDVLRKNFLDCSGFSTITKSGVTCTPVYKNGLLQYVNVNGTSTEHTYFVLLGGNKDRERFLGKEVILSGCPSGASGYYMQCFHYDKNNNAVDYGSGAKFTFTNDTDDFNVSIIIQSGVTMNNVKFYPMLRDSAFTDATYEPYQSQTVNLSAPIELNGIGGVRDTDKLKKFGVVVLDGTESWWKYGDNYPHLFKTDIQPLANGLKSVLCSHFPHDKGSLTGGLDGCRFSNEEISSVFYISSSKHTDVSAFKSWLASNPVTLVYELAEPIETALPQADIDAIKNLHTYKPNTVVMNDADAEMDVHYVADAKTYIDKKFEALASAIVNQ